MARQYGAQATKRYSLPQQLSSQGYSGGNLKMLSDSYAWTGALTTEFIEMGRLPKGARVVDLHVVCPDLDASGGTLDFGWEASEDAVEAASLAGFASNVDVTSAVNYSLRTTGATLAGFNKLFGAEVKVGITVDGDCDATTGTVYWDLTYVID